MEDPSFVSTFIFLFSMPKQVHIFISNSKSANMQSCAPHYKTCETGKDKTFNMI